MSVVESFEFHKEALLNNKISGFIVSAFDLKIRDTHSIRRAIINELSEKNDIPFKVDSGGFQNFTRNANLQPEEIFEIQKSTNCDIAVQLDCPLAPGMSPCAQKESIDKSSRYLEKFLDLNANKMSILPTIHGLTKEVLDYSVQKLQDQIGHEIPAIGIGSLVPLNMTKAGSALVGGKTALIKLLLHVRQKLPDAFLHILGIGGTMGNIALFCGADSIDFMGWVQKAGYGVIQLSGVSDRYPIKKNRRRALDQREKFQFLECLCPACKNHCLEEFDGKGEYSRLLRAIHNVYVYQQDMLRIKRFINENMLKDFVFDRLKSSSLHSILDKSFQILQTMGYYPIKERKKTLDQWMCYDWIKPRKSTTITLMDKIEAR